MADNPINLNLGIFTVRSGQHVSVQVRKGGIAFDSVLLNSDESLLLAQELEEYAEELRSRATGLLGSNDD